MYQVHYITLHKVYKIVPLSSTQDMKERWKDSLYPIWSLEGRRDILSTNAKELDICATVNWYPPALSVSLDSEEGEERVQWRVWSGM